MSLVHNERIKLTATFLNGTGIALLAIGVIASILQGGVTATTVVQAAVSFVAALGLHFAARHLLGRLLP